MSVDWKDKVRMPENIREFADYLYTKFDQEIINETDDEGNVIKKYRPSWYEHLYKRAVFNKIIHDDGSVSYKVSHIAARLDAFIVAEKAYWLSIPQEVRDAINDRYIMNPDIWLPPRIKRNKEQGAVTTILPLEYALEVLEKAETDYYYLAECNCNNYICGCDRDKSHICIHFRKNPDVNMTDGRGLSYRATKEEAIEALKHADRMGLVHKLGETGEGFCNCCTCCCIEHHKAEKYQKELKNGYLQTPYVIKTDPEKCINCGACVKRCPYGALKSDGKTMTVDIEKCWGCGVCRTVCSKHALTIEKR